MVFAKKKIKSIKELTKTGKPDIAVFAVCVDTNLAKWKKAIVEKDVDWINVNGTRSVTPDYHDLYDIYSTPVIYLLNRKKEIIAKRISGKQISGFLEHYEKRNAD